MGAILDLFPCAHQDFFVPPRRRVSKAVTITPNATPGNGAREDVLSHRIDMSAKSAKSEQPESFEAALAELEKIVASMESGKLTLEQSLAAHKRGLELAQYCQGVLARAQQQVKVLEDNTLKNFPGVDDE